LTKQLENEHKRAAGFIKSQVKSRLNQFESTLQSLAQHPSFSERNFVEIRELLHNQIAGDGLIEHVFITYENEEPLFPLFKPLDANTSFSPVLKASQRERLKKAEEYEFKQKRYKNAASVYRELLNTSIDKNVRAQLTSNIGRCLMKLDDYESAIKEYLNVSQEYHDSKTQSGLPLALISRLQVVYCHQSMGDTRKLLADALELYNDVLHMRWSLSEAQFRIYSSLTEDVIEEELPKMKDERERTEYENKFADLKRLYRTKSEQWQTLNELTIEVIPDLQRKEEPSKKQQSLPVRYSKTIRGKIYLLTGVRFPDQLDTDSSGILGVKIKNTAFQDNVLQEIIDSLQFTRDTNIIISSLSGEALVGNKDPSTDTVTVTEFFDDNFPPWRIEFYRAQTESLGVLDMRRNFYFWTILTLIVVLTFGAVLIVRTIAHEMDVLKIKSDFVSSVSHEFKTPLTSIKALAERLQSGKVNDDAKMKHYFSVISQDVDKLIGLVKNILDFSKIEEGKREYDFQDMDIVQLVKEQIHDFKKSEMNKEIEIDAQFQEDIPHLLVDKEVLSQAFNNLLENAVKFSSGKKEIKITIKKDDDNVIIEVSDRGIGIPQDGLDKIFDKFYQGRNALRQTVKGTGLGLTLVKHTVEAHGGRISVQSKVGEGSTFSLILPIKGKGK